MSNNTARWALLAMVCLLPMLSVAQEAVEAEELPNIEENQLCMKCHGRNFFEYPIDEEGNTVNMKMFRGLQIDSASYYQGTHRMFMCTDCHAWDYNTYPHDKSLKLEPKLSCLDCHGGDDTYAKYNFEGIEEEYLKSGHANLPENTYSCWSCHDPHSFKMETRTATNITEVVQKDNSMCIHCHGNPVRPDYYLGGGLELMLANHTWLPSAEKHFRKVRCLDCHAEIREDLVVPHHITEKEKAVRNCVECHTTDSRLLYSLYKFQVMEERGERGFVNGVISGQGWVIGANRSLWLNRIGLVLILMVLSGITIHSIIRIIKK